MGRSTAKHVSLSTRNTLTSVLTAGEGEKAMKIAEVSFIDVKMRWLKCHFAGDIDIKALRVKCGNLGNGCAWVGELGYLDYHHDTCDHALLACLNACKDGTTLVRVLRKDLMTHLKEKCPNRSHQCPYCGVEGKHCDITTSHLESCTKLEVPCPNKGCNDRVPRADIPEHRKTCPFEEVTCKYSTIGCKDKPRRKELKDHESNNQLHLDIAMEAILKQEMRQRTSETQICLLQAQARTNSLEGGGTTNKTTFKMARFSQYKESGEVFYILPFYTHHGGYKMMMRVNANGNGDGKGTHISVFVYLMRGENDDNLIWPFTGDVTVELLNQLEDEEHHQVKIPYGKDEVYNSRVVDRDRATRGWGHNKFISHADLGHDPATNRPATNRQFLKDDCLYFRISVKAAPNPKPWLTCTS